MRRFLPLVAVAVLASAVTAAAIVLPARAGDGDGTGDRAKDGPFAERIAEFEACMKEHSFDLTGDDVTIRVRPGEVTINGERVDAEEFRAAQRECGPPFRPGFGLGLAPLPGLDELPERIPDDLRERMERVEECLQDEGENA